MNDPPTSLVGFGGAASFLGRPSMNDPPTSLVGFGGVASFLGRLSMNDPPTSLVGFGGAASFLGRPSMNDPPTSLVGFGGVASFLGRPSMNDPPTSLVGFGGVASFLGRLSMNDPPTSLVGLHLNVRASSTLSPQELPRCRASIADHFDYQFNRTRIVSEVLSCYLNRIGAGWQPGRYPQLPDVGFRLSIPYHRHRQRSKDACRDQPGVTVRAHRYQQVFTRPSDGLIQRGLQFRWPAIDHKALLFLVGAPTSINQHKPAMIDAIG